MSASLNISLIPASNDISVQMIGSLLGDGWWKFVSGTAPSGPGSILGQLFSVIDIALLMYVSAIMMYTAVVGGLATAHEGVPLGKRYHSVWAPIRGPATWFMLFPLPWAKGLAMIQVILLVAVYWGIGVADDVWSAFVQEVPKYGGMIIPYQGNVQKEQEFVENALINTTVQQYIIKNGNHPMVAKWLWVGDSYSGTWVYGLAPQSNPTPSGIQYGLGTITFKCSSAMNATDAPSSGLISNLWGETKQTARNAFSAVTGAAVTTAQSTQACQDEKANVQMMLGNLIPYANQIVAMNAQSNGGVPSGAELSKIVQQYQQTQNLAYTAASQYGGTAYTNQLQSFAATSSNLGWASSAYYWWTLENINAKAQAQIQSLHATVHLPSSGAVSNYVSAFYQTYIQAVKGLLEKYQAEQNAQTPASQNAQANSAATIGGSGGAGGDSWAGKRLMEIPAAFTSGNPLADVAAFGAKVQHWGEWIFAGGVVVKGASYVASAAGKAAKAVPGAGKLAGAVTGTVGDVLGSLASIAMPLGVMLIVEGAILHYVFPAIPGVIMMIAIVGWLFLVVELMVASVLWAAAHVYAEGEGFAPPQANYGYSAAIGIISRPLLLTVGFIFAFFIMDIGGWFVGEALQAFLTGMGGTQVGIIGFLSMLAVIIATVLMFVKTVLKLITHLADRAPQWIGGHSGQGLGEADIAQNAVSNAGAGAGKYGMYAGDKINAGMDSMVGSAGARRDKAERDAEKAAEKAERDAANGNANKTVTQGLNPGKAGGGATDNSAPPDNKK